MPLEVNMNKTVYERVENNFQYMPQYYFLAIIDLLSQVAFL